ncbi:hypothetical protein JXA32_15085 [Candidatus Sumerlaeota bacterium]|nr:hypothetical protein [Candidatus Sumerlaeota bacterium]
MKFRAAVRLLRVSPCIFLMGCRLLGLSGSNTGEGPERVYPLFFQPDVGLAHEMEVSLTQRLYISNHDIFYQEGPKYYPVLVHGAPKIVGLSDNRQCLAFIEPAVFEQVGNLYIFDFTKKSLRPLTQNEPDSQTSVKDAKWKDGRLYYIEGFALGTQSEGGSLYWVDHDGIQRRLLYDEHGEDGTAMEVVAFEFAPNGSLRLTLRSSGHAGNGKERVVYIDANGDVLKR